MCQGMQEGRLQLLLVGLGSSQRLTAAEAQASLCRSRSVFVPPVCIPRFAFSDAQARHLSMLATQHLPRQLPWATRVPALHHCSASQLVRSWAAQKPFCTMQSPAGGEPLSRVQLQGLSVQQRLAEALIVGGQAPGWLPVPSWADLSMMLQLQSGWVGSLLSSLQQWAVCNRTCRPQLLDACAQRRCRCSKVRQVGPVSLVVAAVPTPTAASRQ